MMIEIYKKYIWMLVAFGWFAINIAYALPSVISSADTFSVIAGFGYLFLVFIPVMIYLLYRVIDSLYGEEDE